MLRVKVTVALGLCDTVDINSVTFSRIPIGQRHALTMLMNLISYLLLSLV